MPKEKLSRRKFTASRTQEPQKLVNESKAKNDNNFCVELTRENFLTPLTQTLTFTSSFIYDIKQCYSTKQLT